MVRHGLVFLFLTIVTQIGGLAWLVALMLRRRLLGFLAIYTALSISALFVAPYFGREPLPCFGDGNMRIQTPFYCVLNRHYVVPELAEVLEDAGNKLAQEYPDAQLRVLDANFPVLDGFPLLPHLSHDDGQKADLAFFYADASGFKPKWERSPIGFFAFQDGPTQCTKSFPSLRWDMGWLQPLFPPADLDAPRMQAIMRILSEDPRVGKILLEPHLVETLGVAHPKVRFQGCRAARHDDHIHFQL